MTPPTHLTQEDMDLFALIDRERLPIWTVCDHPSDHPDYYTARLCYSLPTPEVTIVVVMNKDLNILRDLLAHLGYVRLERQPNDDPVIMETWI